MSSKHYRRGEFNLVGYYIANDVEGPTYRAKIFLRRFAKPKTLYKMVKEDFVLYKTFFAEYA